MSRFVALSATVFAVSFGMVVPSSCGSAGPPAGSHVALSGDSVVGALAEPDGSVRVALVTGTRLEDVNVAADGAVARTALASGTVNNPPSAEPLPRGRVVVAQVVRTQTSSEVHVQDRLLPGAAASDVMMARSKRRHQLWEPAVWASPSGAAAVAFAKNGEEHVALRGAGSRQFRAPIRTGVDQDFGLGLAYNAAGVGVMFTERIDRDIQPDIGLQQVLTDGVLGRRQTLDTGDPIRVLDPVISSDGIGAVGWGESDRFCWQTLGSQPGAALSTRRCARSGGIVRTGIDEIDSVATWSIAWQGDRLTFAAEGSLGGQHRLSVYEARTGGEGRLVQRLRVTPDANNVLLIPLPDGGSELIWEDHAGRRDWAIYGARQLADGTWQSRRILIREGADDDCSDAGAIGLPGGSVAFFTRSELYRLSVG